MMKITLKNTIDKPFNTKEIEQLTHKVKTIPDRYFLLGILIHAITLTIGLYVYSNSLKLASIDYLLFLFIASYTIYSSTRHFQAKALKIHHSFCPVTITFENKVYTISELSDQIKPITPKESRALIELAKQNEQVQHYLKMTGNIRSLYSFELTMLNDFFKAKKKT